MQAAMLASAGTGLVQSRTASAAIAGAADFRIATWGGSWRDSVAKNIVQRMDVQGGSIDYVLGNPDDNLAKLVAARRGGQIPFDAMECNPDQPPVLTKSGLFETLDYAKLPNAATFPSWARGTCVAYTIATQDGIVYNEEKFKSAGIGAPKSYLDLKDPRLAGKVAFPDISNPQHWNAVVGLAMLGGGSETNMTPAIQLVNELKPAYFFAASTDLATRFGSGEIWAAPWHVGWAVRLKRSGVPIAMAYTHFGDKLGALYPVSVGVIKGSPRSAEAYAFVDEYLAPEAQAAHGIATGSLPLNPGAQSALAKDPINQSLMILSADGLKDMFLIDWSRLDTRKWREEWNRSISR
jgi:putative spermidine/putrescine transport system substrate-binding protein